MMYLIGIFVFLILILIPAFMILSFRLGAGIYHSGMRQGPPPSMPLGKSGGKKGEEDKDEKKEDRWDNT